MKMIIDAMAITGALIIAAGVYLEFSLGYALISLGGFLIGFALMAARNYEAGDVPNE